MKDVTMESLRDELSFISGVVNHDDIIEARRHFGKPGKPLSEKTVKKVLECEHNDLDFARDMLVFLKDQIVNRMQGVIDRIIKAS